ncbi:MAG: redoxin domain-containing protein [Actinomycetota bacterium]|nr:redoxin domain-containing protein [Actinomycetota bacterium]
MSWTVLSYAFVLGMVATVNPCGFALLPVYLTSLPRSGGDAPLGAVARVPRAVAAGLAATAGFVAVFGIVGALVSAGISVVMNWVPEIGIAVGVALVVVGGLTAAGRHLSVRLPGATRRLGSGRGLPSMVGFGVSYAAASLGCTLPVFLAGVAGVFTRGGIGAGLGSFVAYALGMGAVLTALAVVYALLPGRRLGRLRALGGRLERPVGALLVLVGCYLVYYWASDLAGGQGTGGLTGTADRVDAAVTSAVSSAGPLLGGVLVALVLGTLLVVRVRHRPGRRSMPRTSTALEEAHAPGQPAMGCCTTGSSPDAATGPALLGATREHWVRSSWRVAVSVLVSLGGAAALIGLGVAAFAGSSVSSAQEPGPAPALIRLMSLDPLNAQSSVRAPGFTLTDQRGKPLSLSSLRGKVVVLVFFDNHCHELCPLFSQDIRAAATDLGQLARRVAFVAVNVNPFYPQVRYDVAFDQRVGLDKVRDWYFLTGPLPTLEAVWHAYGAQPTIGPDKSVTHTSIIEFIDPHGRVRDLGNYGPSSADSTRWGYGLAMMAEYLLGVHQPLAARTPTSVPAGAPGSAPAFSLPALHVGHTAAVSLEAFRGRPVVLNFFATWCSACQAEAAGLGAEARMLAGKAELVGIDVDGNAAQAAGFVRHYGIGYPIGIDASGSVAAAYGVTDLPTTVFVSASGREVGRHIGAISPGELAAEVDQLAGGGRRAGPP